MTAPADQRVYIVDDDDAFRDSLVWLVESAGHRVETFSSAEAFLDVCHRGMAGCLLVDVLMPGLSGLDLHDRLIARDIHLPTIVITGHGDVSMAVTAFRGGAVDFVEKPLDDTYMLSRIERCLAQDREDARLRQQAESASQRLSTLTAREREVFDHVVAGKLNKQIAAMLGIGIKTVEVHRSRVMEKMRVTTVADLIRMSLQLKQNGGG